VTAYTPSETSRRSGFSLDTLRYYDKIGLLGELDRTPGGQRVFSDHDIGWLGLLRCLRDTGMPINQMCRFAELARAGDDTIADRVELLRAHAAAVEEQMALLDQQYAHLRGKIGYYEAELAQRS
jgi:DNA-binding transcriptional MerR regulator